MIDVRWVEIPVKDHKVRLRDLRDLIEATDDLPEDSIVVITPSSVTVERAR